MTAAKIMTSQMFDGPNWESVAIRLAAALEQVVRDLRGGAEAAVVAEYAEKKLSEIK